MKNLGVGEPVVAYVGLGANLGDAVATLVAAIDAINRLPDSRIVRRSSLYRSAPVDASGPDFINAVVELSTTLAAAPLLAALHRIEAEHGRARPWRNAPRTLDLDLLLYGDVTSSDPRLMLPHPRMHQRAFVLLPLAEIAPHCVSAEQLQAVAGQRIERIEQQRPPRADDRP